MQPNFHQLLNFGIYGSKHIPELFNKGTFPQILCLASLLGFIFVCDSSMSGNVFETFGA